MVNNTVGQMAGLGFIATAGEFLGAGVERDDTLVDRDGNGDHVWLDFRCA
ncbi:MAG: hypothetical protein ACRCZY_11735 [Phocaeicola sp.]